MSPSETSTQILFFSTKTALCTVQLFQNSNYKYDQGTQKWYEMNKCPNEDCKT